LTEARFVDGEIGKILDRYRELDILKDTLVVVSSDHGMSSEEKDIDRKALNDAIVAGGWKYEMLTSPRQKPKDDVDLHVMAYGNLQCYFNREFPEEEQERLFDAIGAVEGIGRIYDSMALRRMGAHPNAGDFMVEPAAGWWLGGGGGTHARNRESDGHQSLMGAGVKSGAVVNSARTVDLMPTVLKAFNLPIPPTVDGKVLDGALTDR
jgi:arylsulfatase A-like enzyme